MGFLPGSWTEWGKDGNGDGVADPNNVFDAATAAGYVLCSVGDLSNPATMAKAVLRYNHSASYVNIVLTWAAAYRDGVTPTADSTGSVPAPAPASATTPPGLDPSTVVVAPAAGLHAPAAPAAPAAIDAIDDDHHPPSDHDDHDGPANADDDHDASDHDDDGPADHVGLTSG